MMITVGLMFIAAFFVKEPREIIGMLMAFVLGLCFSMNISTYESHKAANETPVVFEFS
jgi:membrane protein CcdC involved in cytochrome C biogenesis